MSRIKKFDFPNQVHFITGTVNQQEKLFQKYETCSRFLLESINFYRNKLKFKLIGYVVMPEHYHLLILLPEEVTISQILMVLKGYTAKQIVEFLKIEDKKFLNRFRIFNSAKKRSKNSTYRIFQPDNYDFNIKSQDKLIEKLNYIHNNPVKRKLVKQASEYPFSSYRSYFGENDSIVKIDNIFDFCQWQKPLETTHQVSG
jgi:putative transposase